MEMKHFKCRLDKETKERFRLVCEFFNLPMSEVCGGLIKEFLKANHNIEANALLRSKKITVKKDYNSIEEVLKRIVDWIDGQ